MQVSDPAISRTTALTTASTTLPTKPNERGVDLRARMVKAGTVSCLGSQRERTNQAARRPVDLQVLQSMSASEQERPVTPPRTRIGQRRAIPSEEFDPSINSTTNLKTTPLTLHLESVERNVEWCNRRMTAGTAVSLGEQRARITLAARRPANLELNPSSTSPGRDRVATSPQIWAGGRRAKPSEELNDSPPYIGRPPQKTRLLALQQRPFSLPPSYQERLRAGLEPTFAAEEESTAELDPVPSLSLQTLLHRLRQWVQSPADADLVAQEAWIADLRKIIHDQPCTTLEPFQVRLVLLKQMVGLALQLPESSKLSSFLHSNLLHTEQVVQGLYLNSTTPVQDSVWPLHEKILKLPSIEPDLIGAALALVHENLPRASKDNPLVRRLSELLPWLLPPSHYLYYQKHDYALRTLQRIFGELRSLASLFAKVPEGFLQAFCGPIETLANSYQIFLETFEKASEEERQRLCIPKAQLSGVGLGYFLIDQEIGRQLLCRDIQGKECRTIESGTHVVCHLEGVFYKPNPKKKYAPTKEIFYIAPEREFAVYALYQLLGFQGLARTALLKVQHCLFEGQEELGGGVLQASCGVEGISLKDLLGMHQLTHLLDCSLNSDAVPFLSWLLAEDRVDAFARAHPHLNPDTLDALRPEEASHRLLEAFEAPEKPRCLEFNGQFDREEIRLQLYNQISQKGTKPFVAVLAMLERWPLLASKAQKDSRQTSFFELTNLYLDALKAKKQFPSLVPSTLFTTLSKLIERFDLENFSAHFLVTLLTDPCDHKSDNFMVTLEGEAPTLRLFGIDNDRLFSSSPTDIRTMLYLMPAMDQPINPKVWEAFERLTPERLLLDWLITLEKQNERYEQWRQQGTLTEKDLFEEGRACLSVPLKLDSSLISTLYRKAQALTQLLRARPQATHRELLNSLQPQVAAAYQRAAKEGESLAEAYEGLQNAYKEVPRFVEHTSSLAPEEPQAIRSELFRHLQHQVAIACEWAVKEGKSPKEGWEKVSSSDREPPFGNRTPSSPHKKHPRDLALNFLSSLKLDAFSLPIRVELMGKVLGAFPSAMVQPSLWEEATNSTLRQDFFFEAVRQGHRNLVARLLVKERIYRLRGEEERGEYGSLLGARNNQEQTALILACLRLDIDMMRLLVQYGAPLDVYDAAGRSPLACLLSSFFQASAQAEKAIQWLIEQPGLTFNTASDPEGRTPLHQLVDIAQVKPEEMESLLPHLISRGASPDLKDDQGRTTLDLAIQRQNKRLVEQLIKLGAGRVLNVSRTLVYFQNSSQEGLFSLLEAQSLHLRWHMALEALRRPAPPSSFCLEGGKLGRLEISAQFAAELFDEKGNVSPQISYGRRNVAKLIVDGKYPLFFKQYPEMPGVEYAITRLFDLLIGHGTSLTDLVRVTSPTGKNYPLLISQGIEGDNLHDVLNDETKSVRLQQLDRCAFWELFLSSLLVNFEDAKPDNFILEPLPSGHYRLVGIDNDHAFVPPLLKEGGRQVQVKCILYCLDLMQEPVDSIARERFLAQHPEKLIPLWLVQLQEQNQHYLTLFPDNEVKALAKGDENHTGVVIPIPFRAGAITHLYQQWKRLQTALQQSQAPTGFELLRQVIPELGIYYEEAFHTHATPLKRFFSLTRTKYSVAIAGRSPNLVQSRQLLQFIGIPEKIAWKALNPQGPALALEEFNCLEREIRCSQRELQAIRDALQDGNVKPFLALQLDLKKEQVVNGVAGGFEGIDFEAMRQNGEPDLKRQKAVLKALLTGQYRALYLKGCAVLDQRLLKQLLRSSPQLQSLYLSHCTLDQKMLNLLTNARYLTRLRLCAVKGPERMGVPHDYLQQLHLKECHSVETLVVSSTLKSLKLEECRNLTNLEARQFAPISKSFFRDKVLKDFTVDSLYLKACPKLRPWWALFAGWLQASPQNDICLRKVALIPTKQHVEDLLLGISELPPATMKELRVDILFFCCADQTSLDLSGLQSIDDTIFALIAQKRPQLTQFNLEGCLWMTDKGLTALAIASPNLTQVNLNWCYRITDKGINALAQGCSQLNKVDLSYCKQITDEGIRALAQGCSRLTQVDLSWCEQITDDEVIALAQGCPQLTHLNLRGCDNITDEGIRALARGCPQLNWLNLHEDNITDEGIRALARGCPRLTEVSLPKSGKVTDEGVRALAQGCPNLTHVDLQDCGSITDSAIRDLAQGCPQLIEVNLDLCKQVTDTGIRALAHDCPQLSRVSLYACSQITDEGIKALAQDCPQLSRVNLYACSQVTDEGIRALAQGCSQLTSVNLNGCYKITHEAIRTLKKKYPLITFIR